MVCLIKFIYVMYRSRTVVNSITELIVFVLTNIRNENNKKQKENKKHKKERKKYIIIFIEN